MEVEEILSDLIKIPSVNPPGNEAAAASYLKDLFDRAGIENEVIESAPGRASFIASIGEGERSLLFLSHLDVVPPGEGWDFDPFSGEIRDGLILGRGALDCKGLVAAEAWAMLQLARNRLGGRLIFAATADEEAGGKYGVVYILENCPEKLMADFAINEGGEEPVTIGGETVYFIQMGEKGVAWTKLSTRGISCHGSVPTLGDNAVIKMCRALERLAGFRDRIRIIPELRPLFDFLAEKTGWGRIDENNLDQFLDSYQDRTFAEALRSVTRMTVSPNVIQGGTKVNIVPDSCEARIDIRVLPGQDMDYVLARLRPLLGTEVEIELPDFHPASFSPTDSPHFHLIVQTIKEVAGEVRCFPIISAGATDSRFLRLKGIPSYGPAVAAPDIDPGIRRSYHARNERADIKGLKLKAEFLKRLALNYLGQG